MLYEVITLLRVHEAVGEVAAGRALHGREVIRGEDGCLDDQLAEAGVDGLELLDDAPGHLPATFHR